MVPSCFIVALVLVNLIYAAETDWTNLRNHPSWSILDNQYCGETSADRIIGGTNAAMGQFPWLVRLGYISENDDEVGWLCGGSLITNKHVLTAAHCAGGDMAEYKLNLVRVGEYDIDTDPDCRLGICAPKVQDIVISKIVVHENFNKPMFHNDIALLHMEKPAHLSAFAVPLCIPRERQPEVIVGENCVVAGWGKTNITTDERASILQFVQIPILDKEVCNQLNTNLFKISDNEICAGAQFNKDACGGDSGGPLMKVYDTEEGPKSFVVGVVSFGPTQCGIRKPGVYTSVHRFTKWILDNL